MFDEQIETFNIAFGWLPADILTFIIAIITFLLILSIVRIFWS